MGSQRSHQLHVDQAELTQSCCSGRGVVSVVLMLEDHGARSHEKKQRRGPMQSGNGAADTGTYEDPQPRCPDRVYGWQLRAGDFQPLTAGEVFDAYCANIDSCDPISPESDANYCARPDLSPGRPDAGTPPLNGPPPALARQRDGPRSQN